MSVDKSGNKTRRDVVWFLLQGLTEVLATGMLVFIGCSGVTPGLSDTPPSHLQICIVFGIAVTILVQVFGRISGCHINPSVTLAALVYKEISLTTAGMYILAQYLGAALGYGSLLFMTPREVLYTDRRMMSHNVTHGFCTTVPNPQISTIQALGSEFFATSILVYVCCSFWDKSNSAHQDSAPFKFGLTVTGLATAFGPFSGGSMNPARSFAPALFTGVWDRQWIYWLGPLSASVLVTYFYKFTFERNQNHDSKHDSSEVPLNHLNSRVQNFEKISTQEVA